MAKAPTRFWRVIYDAAVGFPEPDRRVRKTRHYTSAADAGRQVHVVRHGPLAATHLALVSVDVSNEVEWTPVDADELPIPELQTSDEGN